MTGRLNRPSDWVIWSSKLSINLGTGFRFAFVEVPKQEMVEKAKRSMDDKLIEGRRIIVRGTKVKSCSSVNPLYDGQSTSIDA